MDHAATWDLYCRVVDNHGDLGVCWRLAVGLAANGLQVRLWCDDLDRLAWMAPRGAIGVATGSWQEAIATVPGAVVVETFGCDLPPEVLAAMARRAVAPVWIDLEYLTAEPYAERCHGLASPQSTGPGAGQTRWFFYPGFSVHGGGLLHGPDPIAEQRRFDPAAWLHRHGGVRAPQERVVSLFCYADAPVPALLDRLASEPTLVLATAGEAAQAVEAALGPSLRHGALRAVCLPFLAQADYDRLLWASDLNLVRGEDSFVRAQLAGRPFLWQIYPQHDAAHLGKLDAFMQLYARTTDADAGSAVIDWERLMLAWNGSPATNGALPAMPFWPSLTDRAQRWQAFLLAQPDLVDRLVAFAAARTAPSPHLI